MFKGEAMVRSGAGLPASLLTLPVAAAAHVDGEAPLLRDLVFLSAETEPSLLGPHGGIYAEEGVRKNKFVLFNRGWLLNPMCALKVQGLEGSARPSSRRGPSRC